MKLYEIDKEVERLIEEGMDPETGELLSVDAIEALLNFLLEDFHISHFHFLLSFGGVLFFMAILYNYVVI